MKSLFTIDRFFILLTSICLSIILFTNDQVKTAFIYIAVILIIILLFRLAKYSSGSSPKSNPDCQRGHNATIMMKKLADEMKVKLHTSKSLEIVPGFKGAKSLSLPFFPGRVTLGCTTLCGLDDIALNGVLAHELAHIKKNHSTKNLFPFLLYIPVLILGIITQSFPLTAFLLTFSIWIFVCSLISWHHEYEADAIAANYIGNNNMAYALEKVTTLLDRPGDTLIHPSFNKRIARLLSDKE